MCELGPDSVLRLVLPPDRSLPPGSPAAGPGGLAHRAIVAALDAVLGQHGAAVEDHELVDAALHELLDAATSARTSGGRPHAGAAEARRKSPDDPLVVVVDDPRGDLVLRLCHGGAELALDADAQELVQDVFPSLDLRPGRARAARPLPLPPVHLGSVGGAPTWPAEVSEPRGPRYGRPLEDLLLHVDVPVDVARLPAVRLVVRRALPLLEPEDASLFYGAMTEIITNAIEAHQRAGLDTPVRVELPTGRPRVVVLDDGGGFDPHRIGATDVGRGLTIALAVCPDMEIRSTIGGTEVVLPLPEGAR